MQTVAPVTLAALSQGTEAAVTTSMAHLYTLVQSPPLDADAQKYAAMLCDLVSGQSASKTLENAGLLDKVDSSAEDLQVVYKTFGPACMIEMAMPVSAHFLLKYDVQFIQGLDFHTGY